MSAKTPEVHPLPSGPLEACLVDGDTEQLELRAVISTEGSISSLEVVRGDPLFIRASYDAVQQWRYRPLVLNGQPVEVETYIMVVFALQH